ncbi:MAG: hypothetical protein LBH40_06105, partial [Alphaproteobacteria bacterium]|nr:hypothetical protein [Alphaproteobacteria bacterium]
LDNAKSLSQTLWFFETEGFDLSLPEVAMSVLRELEKRVSKIKDKQLRERFLSFFKNKIYSYGENNNSILYKNQQQDSIKLSAKKLNYATERDALLIACILCYPEILYDVEEKLGLCQFKDATLNKLKNIFLQNIDLLQSKENSILLEVQNECSYVFNMHSVQLKLPKLTTKEDAISIFNDSYNLILKENLEQEKQETIQKIKRLGEQLTQEDNTNIEQIKHKIQILMQQQIEISKYIDILVKGKIDA